MDVATVRTMVESSHASAAHLAQHFNVSLAEMLAFLRENQIPVPTALHPQFRHLSKLIGAQLPKDVPWEDLVFDDAEHRFINGIDTKETMGRINAEEILKFYQGGPSRCVFSNEETTAVLAFDTNSQNFLVSNLVPVDKEIAKARGYEDILPMVVVSKTYECVSYRRREEKSEEKIKVSIHLHGRFDRTFGAIFNVVYIDALIDQWVEPYLQLPLKSLMPENTPVTPETLALWLWKHLSTVAFIKGLARLDVEYRGVTAHLTKDLYLQMVLELLQKAVQSRAIARPSGIVLPTSAEVSEVSNIRR